jgi:hypothetical protein
LNTPNSDWENSGRPGQSSQEFYPTKDDGSVRTPSTNHAFVQHIASVSEGIGVSTQHDFRRSTQAEAGRLQRFLVSPPDPTYELKDLVLPPRHAGDDLLEWYWEFIHPLTPVLHQPTFTASYERLWQPRNASSSQGDVGNAVFYATLNMVFALGCQRNEQYEPTERDNLADEFYGRSLKLVSIDTLDVSSLSVVQLLVLRGLYLLYGSYADRCWSVVSVAIRVAQAMKLDKHSSHSSSPNQLTREMRRRIWYSCVILDRYVLLALTKRTTILRDTDS